MAYEGTNYQEMIRRQYEEALAAQQAQLQAGYDTQTATFQKQIADAPGAYQPMRNQAFVNNAMAERARREQMANMGLSGMGGMSQTLQQRNTGQLLNTVGAANRQQQGFVDNVNLAMGNLGTDYQANLAAAQAQNQAALNADLISQSRWQEERAAQESQQKFEQAWALYNKRLITAKQFEQMTGVKVKNLPSSGGGGRRNPTLAELLAELAERNKPTKTPVNIPNNYSNILPGQRTPSSFGF